MTAKPISLPTAIDLLEDAIAGIERRVPKMERAVAKLAEVLERTPVDDATPFKSDIDQLNSRIESVIKRLED